MPETAHMLPLLMLKLLIGDHRSVYHITHNSIMCTEEAGIVCWS